MKSYLCAGVLNSSQDVYSIQMDAEVGFLLSCEYAKDLPSSSSALQACISQCLSENNVDNLLSQKQLSALGILDNVGDGTSSHRSRFRLGTLEILEDGQNALLPESCQLGVGGRLYWFGDGIRALASFASVATAFGHDEERV